MGGGAREVQPEELLHGFAVSGAKFCLFSNLSSSIVLDLKPIKRVLASMLFENSPKCPGPLSGGSNGTKPEIYF